MTDILIVDDDPVFGELLIDQLSNTRYSVEFHHGPFGTLNAIRAAQPKLVIMDVNMPGLNGASIGDLMRDTPGLQKTKILLFSSMHIDDLNELLATHHAHAVLQKSSSRGELMDVIAQLIRV